MTDKAKGSVMGGAIWMIVISLLLCWLPGAGGFVGGLVGGKVAGGVGSSLLAWIISSLLVAAVFGLLGTALTGIVVVGVLAGMGAIVIGVLDAGMRLVGALIGGFLA
mgnify:CR=1 FL=1